MNQIKNLRAAVVVALLTAAAGAQADTVNLRDAVSQPLVVTTSIYINDPNLSGIFHGVVHNAQIGSYRLEQQTPSSSFAAYCVDPFQLSSASFQPYSRLPLSAVNLPPVQAARFADVSKLFGNAYAGSLTNATKAAGFQLALWEVWHDDKNLGTGSIRSSGYSDSASVTEAQNLLNSMGGWSAGNAYALTFYQSDTYQDYVSAAPEPGTYALLLAGLAVLGVARRRQA